MNIILEQPEELSEPPNPRVDIEFHEMEDFENDKFSEDAQKDYFNSFFQEAYNNIEGNI